MAVVNVSKHYIKFQHFLKIQIRDYLEIFKPDNQARNEAGLSGFFSNTTFKSLTRCGSSGSESAVINAIGTFS